MNEKNENNHPFEFTGKGGEYFRIWIVNLLLTISTFGIYSAWAKVRTNRYFYNNTNVAGANFDYLADPKRIPRGRIILFTIIAIIGGISYAILSFSKIELSLEEFMNLCISSLLILTFPWLIVHSYAFRAHNTSYRNIRFNFQGKVSQAYMEYLVKSLLIAPPILLLLLYSQIGKKEAEDLFFIAMPLFLSYITFLFAIIYLTRTEHEGSR